MAADADRFSVTTKMTLAVAVTPLGVVGTTRRASPVLCHSAKSSGERRVLGDLEKEDKSALTVDPLCPKAV